MNVAHNKTSRSQSLSVVLCNVGPDYEFGLCRALDAVGLLSPSDRQAVHEVPARRIVHRGRDLDDVVPVICEGWAASTVALSNGRRQILSFLLPGDLASTALLFEAPAHITVEAITDVRLRTFDRKRLRAALFGDAILFEKLSTIWTAEKMRSDRMIIGLGRCSADERIAQLILDLQTRLQERGMVSGATFEFPLRQHHIADAIGLTPVHVSKILTEFRRSGLIELNDRSLTVLDRGRLEHIAALR